MKIGTFLEQIIALQELHQINDLEKVLKSPTLEGITYVDGSSSVYDRYNVKEVKQILDTCGIQTASIYHWFYYDKLARRGLDGIKDDIKLQIERCKMTGANLFMPVPQCNHEIERSEWQKYILDYFFMVKEYAMSYGIKTVIENYSDTVNPYATIDDIAYFLEQIPEMGYVLDAGNFWFNNTDVLKACDKFLPRTEHVHLKDLRPMSENAPMMILGKGCESVAIGEGIIPIEQILDKLQYYGYDGTLTIEINSNIDLRGKIYRSIQYLKKQLI